MQAFVDRFRAKASKARQAQSRIKMLAKMKPIAARSMDAARRSPSASPERARRRSSPWTASVGYEPGKPILCARSQPAHRSRRPHRALWARTATANRLREIAGEQLPLMEGRDRAGAQAGCRLFRPASARRAGRRAHALSSTAAADPGAPKRVRGARGGFGFSARGADTKVAESVGRRDGAADARRSPPSTSRIC